MSYNTNNRNRLEKTIVKLLFLQIIIIVVVFVTPLCAQNLSNINPQSAQTATAGRQVGPNPKCKDIADNITAMSKLTSSQKVYAWENPDWVQNYIGPAKVVNGINQISYLWICPGMNKTWIELMLIKGNKLGVPYTGAFSSNCSENGCAMFGFKRTGSDIRGFSRNLTISKPNS